MRRMLEACRSGFVCVWDVVVVVVMVVVVVVVMVMMM